MKKLLIVITNFRHGGTNKSLENLLSLIDKDNYLVDVFAMEHYGPYKEMLPNCTILPENKWLSALIAHYNDTKGIARFRSFFIKILRNIGSKLNFNLTTKLYKKTLKSLLNGKSYDAVIAYSEGVSTTFISLLDHPNKIAWIHCDYSSYMTINNYPDETRIYKAFKSIVCVSEYTKKEFCRIIPSLCNKTFSLHNLLNILDINKKSSIKSSDQRFSTKNFTIISIGTFYAIKRLSIIPDLAHELLKRGNDFTWYVIGSIGDSYEFNAFETKIANYKIQNNVKYLGEKQNPYFYLKNSDLFVSLSVTEACPYVINESKALHIPLVCTDFPSAPEFVKNGVIGFITPVNEVVDKVELLIKDSILYNKIKRNAQTHSYDNVVLINQFYDILNF